MARNKVTAEELSGWVTDMREILNRASKDRDGRPVLYLIVRHVTRSGMSRSISTFAVVDGEPYVLDYRISKILGWSTDPRNGGVRVSGCGMDMGFHLVYTLASVVYRDAPGTTPQGLGYRLSHRWL